MYLLICCLNSYTLIAKRQGSLGTSGLAFSAQYWRACAYPSVLHRWFQLEILTGQVGVSIQQEHTPLDAFWHRGWTVYWLWSLRVLHLTRGISKEVHNFLSQPFGITCMLGMVTSSFHQLGVSDLVGLPFQLHLIIVNRWLWWWALPIPGAPCLVVGASRKCSSSGPKVGVGPGSLSSTSPPHSHLPLGFSQGIFPGGHPPPSWSRKVTCFFQPMGAQGLGTPLLEPPPGAAVAMRVLAFGRFCPCWLPELNLSISCSRRWFASNSLQCPSLASLRAWLCGSSFITWVQQWDSAWQLGCTTACGGSPQIFFWPGGTLPPCHICSSKEVQISWSRTSNHSGPYGWGAQ